MRLRRALMLEGLEVPLARVQEGSELQLDLRLDALVDGIRARGSVEGEVTVACRRCLTDVAQHTLVNIDELFVGEGEAVADDQAYPLADEAVDLEPMLRDAIVLSLPSNPLCRPDCKGLCPVCGADRNELDCGHDGGRVDIRWGPLADLRRRMEG